MEPNNCKAWLCLALALEENGQTDEAINAYKKIISIDSEMIPIYKKLADIYYFLKSDPVSTINYYEKFLKYEPDNIDAKACLSLAYLKTKRYEKGWEYFEFRPHKARAVLKWEDKNPLIKTKPLWQGENIKNKTLYVYAEAGFGDTMMFVRYLPLLMAECKKVLFEPELNNVKLFMDSDLGVEFIDPLKAGELTNFDLHTPIMSLPYLLKAKTEEDIPFTTRYLKANPQKAKKYNESYFKNDKFKIGIKWQGIESEEITRKIELKSFYKLFNLPNLKFYSLQRDDGVEQLEDAKQFKIVDLGKTFEDFSDTAAAIENLDLIICNDTSVAHLAGALGKECWILLPFNQDWRWSTDLTYCPWYKSVRMFKQKEAWNWYEVIDRVFEELKQKFENKC